MGQTAVSPRLEDHSAFSVLGIAFNATPESDFSVFWRRYAVRQREFDGTIPKHEAYAVEYNLDEAADTFTYVTGFEFDGEESVPIDWTVVEIPAATFAVFETTLDTVDITKEAIYTTWLPDSEYVRAQGPAFEYYHPEFDADDPDSTFRLYIPVSLS